MYFVGYIELPTEIRSQSYVVSYYVAQWVVLYNQQVYMCLTVYRVSCAVYGPCPIFLHI